MNKKTKLMLAALCAAVTFSAAGTVLFATPLTAEAAVVIDANGGISVDGVEKDVVINFAEQSTTVDFGMAVGCSVRYTNDEYSGIRWMTVISKAGYEELVSKYDAVAMGTLVTKTALSAENFTVDYIQANSVEFWYAPADNTVEENGYIRFNAVKTEIGAEDYATPFYARSYIALKSGESVTYVYSDYVEANHSRTIQEVAIDAIGAHNSGAESKQISEAGLTELCKYAGVDSADEIGSIVYNVDGEVKYAGYVKGAGEAELLAPTKEGATFYGWYDMDYNKVTAIGADATENYNLTAIWAYEVSGTATAAQGGNEWALSEGTTLTLTHTTGESVTATVGANGAYTATLPDGNYTVSANGYVSGSLSVADASTEADVQLTYKLTNSANDNGTTFSPLSDVWMNLPSKAFTLEYDFNLTSATPVGSNMDANVLFAFYEGEWSGEKGMFESIFWDNTELHVRERSTDGSTRKTFTITPAQAVEQGGVRIKIICDGSNLAMYAKVNGVWQACFSGFDVSGYNYVDITAWGADSAKSILEDYTYLPYVVDTFDVSGNATATSGIYGWEMSGVELTLTNTADANVSYKTTTAVDGSYTFTDVTMGNYTLTAANHAGSVALPVFGDVEAYASEFDYKLTEWATDDGSSISDISSDTQTLNVSEDSFTLEYVIKLKDSAVGANEYDASIWIGVGDIEVRPGFWGTSETSVIAYNKVNQSSGSNGQYTTTFDDVKTNGIRARIVKDGNTLKVYLLNGGIWVQHDTTIDVTEFSGIQMNANGNKADVYVASYVYYPYVMETYAVSGTLTATSGTSEAWNLPAGVNVTLTSAENVFTTTTGENGAYSLEIPAGTYTLTAEGCTGSKEIVVTDSAVTEQNAQLVWTLIPFTDVNGEVHFTQDGWEYPGNVNLLGDNWTMEYVIKSSRTEIPTGSETSKWAGIYLEGVGYLQVGVWKAATDANGIYVAKTINSTNDGSINVATTDADVLSVCENGVRVKLVKSGASLTIFASANEEWTQIGGTYDGSALTAVGIVTWSTEFYFSSYSYTVD